MGGRRVQCLLKQGTDTTHEIQLQIKGSFEDDPEWSEIIKARIQKRKKEKKNQTQNKTHLVDSDIKQSRRLNTLLKKKKKKGMGLISRSHRYKKESKKTLERF